MSRYPIWLLAAITSLLIISCNSESKESSNFNSPFKSGIHDPVVSSFSDISAMHTFKDSSMVWMLHNYILAQRYSTGEGEAPYTGEVRNFYPTDTLKTKGVFEEGKLLHYLKQYPNGKKHTEVIIKRPEGESSRASVKSWYQTGELKSEGKLGGIGKQYYKDGTLKTEMTPTQTINYWQNGNKKMIWPLDKKNSINTPHGQVKAWHQNGQLGIKGYDDNGDKVGEWTYFDSLGNINKVEFYKEGRLDSTNQYSKS